LLHVLSSWCLQHLSSEIASFQNIFARFLTCALDRYAMQWMKSSSGTMCQMADKTSPLNSLAIDPKSLTPSMVSWVQKQIGPIGYTFALSPICRHMIWTLHIITWPSRSIDLDSTCSSPLHRSIGAKSCSSFTAATVHHLEASTCPSPSNRSIKPSPSLDLHLSIIWHVSCLIFN
jgi:hypothetical protein